jgi:hypothetical protein
MPYFSVKTSKPMETSAAADLAIKHPPRSALQRMRKQRRHL